MAGLSGSAATDFEEYAREVYGWAYRLLGRHHDALDVVQDVFVRWHEQCAVDAPGRPRGWLRRVTVNRAIDVRRRRRPEAEAAMERIESPKREQAAPSLDRERLRDDIAAALDALTDVQRGVLIAKVYDDMTFSQIAEELALAVSTVKTHYLRAVRAVRDRLQPRWSEEDSP